RYAPLQRERPDRSRALHLVRPAGIEPATPTVSRWCSTAELRTRAGLWRVAAPPGRVKQFASYAGCGGRRIRSMKIARYWAQEITMHSAAIIARAISSGPGSTSRAPWTRAKMLAAARNAVPYLPKRVGRIA